MVKSLGWACHCTKPNKLVFRALGSRFKKRNLGSIVTCSIMAGGGLIPRSLPIFDGKVYDD